MKIVANARKLIGVSVLTMAVMHTPAAMAGDRQTEIANLIAFDMVDFVAWNNRDMTVLRHYHADSVKVDITGVHTEGIQEHVDMLQGIIDSGSASTIIQHLPKVAEGDWTAVGGVTPKSRMATVAKWENGRIAEEYLFLRPLDDKEIAAIDVATAIVTINTPDDAELRSATGAVAGWSAAMGKDFVVFTHTEKGAVVERLGFATK